mgnify:CR=1 FL=1
MFIYVRLWLRFSIWRRFRLYSRFVYPFGCGGDAPGYGTYCWIQKTDIDRSVFLWHIRWWSRLANETTRSHIKRWEEPAVGFRFLVPGQFPLEIPNNRYIPARPSLNIAIQCGWYQSLVNGAYTFFIPPFKKGQSHKGVIPRLYWYECLVHGG